MKVMELYKHLSEVITRNPDLVGEAEVVFQPPRSMKMFPADFTLTYISKHRPDSVHYDQVPVLCISVVEEHDQ